MTAQSWTPPILTPLTGAEPIAGTLATLRDFRSWATSDLRSNTVRSRLAEYLVACAVGAHDRLRVEWDSWDVTIPSGGRLEVKASAYVQA